ncbi:MAG: hypothetical protein AAGG79_03910, partial [Pseudomonadota bacterium]
KADLDGVGGLGSAGGEDRCRRNGGHQMLHWGLPPSCIRGCCPSAREHNRNDVTQGLTPRQRMPDSLKFTSILTVSAGGLGSGPVKLSADAAHHFFISVRVDRLSEALISGLLALPVAWLQCGAGEHHMSLHGLNSVNWVGCLLAGDGVTPPAAAAL